MLVVAGTIGMYELGLISYDHKYIVESTISIVVIEHVFCNTIWKILGG